MASTWFFIATSRTIFSQPVFVYTSREPAIPMRSTSPLQSIVSPFMSKSWNLSDDEPQFTTRTFCISFFIFAWR